MEVCLHKLCGSQRPLLAQISSLKVDPIIRGGIRRFTDMIGQLWCSLADYYIRSGHFEKVNRLSFIYNVLCRKYSKVAPKIGPFLLTSSESHFIIHVHLYHPPHPHTPHTHTHTHWHLFILTNGKSSSLYLTLIVHVATSHKTPNKIILR